jgi:hypothetical protein
VNLNNLYNHNGRFIVQYCADLKILIVGHCVLNVIFYVYLVAPRPRHEKIEQFGFKVGEEGVISVQIQAYPKPRFTWIVDQDSISEGQMDTSQRFEATSVSNMVCVPPVLLIFRLPICFIDHHSTSLVHPFCI